MTRSLEHHLRGGVRATSFCPGCGHGILLHAVIRAVEELALDRNHLLFVSGIGCAAWIPSPHIKADTLHTLHGRAVAYATGAKVANPRLKVVVVSGDGDLASIGGNHLIHAARRGLDLTVICANNEIYGMTGGQVGPTTHVGSLTATTPKGNRDAPFDLVKLVLGAGAAYAARHTVLQPRPLTEAIKTALLLPAFAFVEAVSPCPTQFGRRNRVDTIPALFEQMRQKTVTREDVARLPPGQLRGRIVTGEWRSEELQLPGSAAPGGAAC